MTIDVMLAEFPFSEYYLFAMLSFIPTVRIIERAGFQPYWSLLLGVPDVGLALCALVLALKKWPKEVSECNI